MFRCRILAVASAAVFFGFVAFGATQEWSGSVTVDADVADDITLDGTVEVTVASGSTFTLSGTISDKSGTAGKIKLIGGGTLVLAHTNDFTGGAYIDTGVLKAATGGALGTGKITIAGGTTKASQLWFGDMSDGVTGNTTITFPNDIDIEAGGNSSHYQLHYGPHGAAGNRKSLTLRGKVTCAGDLYFENDDTFTTYGNNLLLTFNGEVDVDGTFYFSKATINTSFKSSLKAKVLSYSSTGSATITFAGGNNSIGMIEASRVKFECKAANALSGASVLFNSGTGTTSGSILIDTYDQTVAYLKTTGFTASTMNVAPYIHSISSKTLTLTGGVETAVFEGSFGSSRSKYNYKLSLTMDAADQPDFTQVVTNSEHTLNGTITVKNGNLFFGGATTCSNLTGIVVNGGSFTFDTTYNGEVPALNSLSKLTVKKGAKLVLKGTNLFKSDMSLALTIESGALIDIPAGTFNVSSLKVDGRTWAAGEYTRAMLPMLPDGVTLNVTAGSWGTETVSVDWTGEGSDNATTTANNWSQYVPIKTGIAYATLTGGDGIDYNDGDWFNRIVNGITPDAENKVAPFVIRPTSETSILHLTRGLVSSEKTQLVLSGLITDLPERSESEENHVYYKPSAVVAGVQDAIQPAGYASNGALPLVLTNAVLDMSLDIVSAESKFSLMAAAGTTNEVREIAGTGNNLYMFASSGSVTRFENGFSSSGACLFKGAGEFAIGGSADFTRGFSIRDDFTMSLATTNSFFAGKTTTTREGIEIDDGKFNMLVDEVLADTLQMASLDNSSKAVFELNTTTQTVGAINFNAKSSNVSSWLHGDYPALLKVAGKYREGALVTKLKPLYVSAQIKGGLSILFTGEGTNEVFMLAGRAFESCGDLEVSAKTLELASGASWLNGTNFTARGEGTLKFNGNNQVSKDFAQLHIAGNGKVEIPEGVTVHVSAADLDGTAVDNGSYKTGDEGIGAHITGLGTLKVGQRGTALILQ